MKEKIKVGNVLTDEIMSTIGNADITDQQVGQIMRAILFKEAFGEPSDPLVKILVKTYYKDYVKLTLSCAEGKLKELERLYKFYSNKGRECPPWFPAYYDENKKRLTNDIVMFSNVIGCPTNISEDATNVSETLRKHSANVPLTFAIDNNTKTKANTKTKTKDTDIENIPPKSPKGEFGASSSSSSVAPRSVLDDPMTALGLAEGGDAADEADAEKVASEIERTYRFHVNGKKLRKCVLSVLKKSGAAEVLNGYRAWLDMWADDDFQWAPQRITDWLYNMQYLDKPRRGVNRNARPETSFGGSDLA